MVRNTPKAMALGAKLRAAREQQSLSLRALAKLVGIEHTQLGRFELGERSPSPEQVAAILAVLGVNGHQAEEVIELSRDTTGSSWLAVGLPEQRVQLDALLEIEQLATTIVDVSPLVIPGLLQVSGYARAIMRAAAVPETEVETRVAIRMGRRDVLTRAHPVRYTALIGEQILRQQIGGSAVMSEQLDHLLKMSQLDNVELRAFPVDGGWHDGLVSAFSLLKIDSDRTVVHLEIHNSGLFIQEKDDVAAFHTAVERTLNASMSAEQTSELIAREAHRVKRDR